MLFPVFLVFLLLLLCHYIVALMVVWWDGRAHGVHWTNSAVSDSGMGVAVAS